jgi:hypothetical protein
MLARLRMPPAKIRAAVWEVDDTTLDVDQLAMLSRMLPTRDEVSPALDVLISISDRLRAIN